MVATEDDRIAEHASALGVDTAMTSISLDSGSARAYAAASGRLRIPHGVINLQGDAPFIPPATIATLTQTLRDGRAQIITPVYQLDWARLDHLREHKRKAPFSGTTCVRDEMGRALWFSKTIIPALRNELALREQELSPVWQHIGLYAYSLEALAWFVETPQSHQEALEGLEQLRFLEHGWEITTVSVPPPTHALSGIDTPHDLELAEQAIAEMGEPSTV